MRKRIEFRRQKDFGEAINDTLTFLKQNLKPLARVFFTFCGFFIVAGMLAMIMFEVRADNANVSYAARRFGIASLAQLASTEYILAMLFTIASYTAMQASIVSYIKLYVEKGNVPPTIDEVWGYVKYYFLRVFGSSILLAIFLILGFLCCLLPGVWLFPIVSLFYPIMIIENGSVEYSFSRMFKVVKNNWWLTAGIILIVWVIVYATTLLVTVPTTIMSLLDVFRGVSSKTNLTFVILNTVFQYACQIFMILPVICCTVCYYSLVEKKESPGLLDRMEHFGQKPVDLNHMEEEY